MQLIDEKHTQKLYWFLLILYFGGFTVYTFSTALAPALIANDWANLSAQKIFQIVLSVIANWLGIVLALILKTLVRMARGLPPIETGDTSHLYKDKTK